MLNVVCKRLFTRPSYFGEIVDFGRNANLQLRLPPGMRHYACLRNDRFQESYRYCIASENGDENTNDFADSLFNVPRKRAMDVCEEIIRRNVKFRSLST
jgi:hypothetical protein